MFAKVSVLVPTRGRVANLQRLVESYRRTAGDGINSELVFRVDDDDAASITFLSMTPYEIIIGPRLGGYRSLPVFFEELRARATGDVYMCGNDDMEFLTSEWPTLLLKRANEHPDGVFNLAVHTYNEGNVPFSVVSKKAVDAIGYLQHPAIYWGDVYLRDVMSVFGRVIPVPEVHVAHHWMGHAPDQTFTEADQDISGSWTNEHRRRHANAVDDAVGRLGTLCSA